MPLRAALLSLGIVVLAYATHADDGRAAFMLAVLGGALIGVWSMLNDRRAV